MRVQNGYLRRPTWHDFRPMTADEIRALQPGMRAWFLANDGMARQVTINGAVKTWKRDPERMRIPVKYGLREYAAWDGHEALNRFLVLGEEVPHG